MAGNERVDGLTIAVTGGARGIGLATATLLHRRGATVVIGDLDEAEATAAALQVGLAAAHHLDVTDEHSFAAFLDSVENDLGPVDVLVNNAGIIAVGPAVDEADAVTKQLLAVNAYGVMLGTKLAAERMLLRRRGHIINIASTSAVMPVPGIATYSATKHAVLGFTDAIRLENRRSGVHFSVVLPNLTNTEMVEGIGHARGFKNIEPGAVAQAVLGLIKKPKPRVVVPRSLGAVVLTGRRFLPQIAYEMLERSLGAERVFQDDVDPDGRRGYTARTGTP